MSLKMEEAARNKLIARVLERYRAAYPDHAISERDVRAELDRILQGTTGPGQVVFTPKKDNTGGTS